MSIISVQTPLLVEGGGTIAISKITSSATVLGSRNTQAHASQFGPFSYGMPTSGIPSFSFSAASTVSAPIPSMASGSASFQGFPFGSGHIPHSTPSLGSLPFTSQTQGFNPFSGGQSSNVFTGWNPVFTMLRVGTQFIAGQQGNVPFPSSSNS